jgi:CRISPR-associated endonuclease Cas1
MLSEVDNAPSLTPGHFDDWAKRNDYWLARPLKRSHRPKGVRPAEPLILCGHGVALTVDRDALFIRNGLTHYPQARETHRFFKGDPDLPSRIIMLDGSGSLSFAVLSWLSEQRVALFKLDYRGGLVSILAGRGRAFDSERVQWQIETRADPARRMAFCCDLIGDKLRASVATLRSRIPDTAARATAIETAERLMERLASHPPDTVAALMMVEARAASAYFRAWRGLPIRWKGLTRHPIPETWRETTARRSYGPGGGSPNRNATHPVNAMLNYAYAVLHSAVQIETIADGYDPTLGLMHESREDRAALVLDLMERRRPVADAAVLKLLNDNVFSGADFVRTAEGVCRVAPQLAKVLCKYA